MFEIEILLEGGEQMAATWHKSFAAQYGSLTEGDREYWRSVRTKGLYLLLQQVDLVLTVFASSIGLVEMNPVMRSLLASPPQLIAVKVVIPLLIAWLVPGRLLVPAIAFLAAVIGWNVKELVVGF